MAVTACVATIRRVGDGARAFVRTAPGVTNSILGYAPDDLSGYHVLESKLDATGLSWLRLEFVGGASGWVSADRLNIEGNCGAAGYGIVPPPPKQASTLPHIDPNQPIPDNIERVRAAAYNITVGFEGGAYNTYQNYDAGIVSFGRFGFTLASGSLFSVLDRYLSRATSSVAARLRTQYLDRVRNRDASLREDTTLRDLLRASSVDVLMQKAQDEIVTELYWNLVQDLSINPRNLKFALTNAFFFDMAINHGARHDMITEAEVFFNVPPKSRIGENGISEQQLVSKIALIRRDRMYRIADAQNLPGLKPRGDFWVTITQTGDWKLQGDSEGNVLIKPGRSIQVRNP
ncbi:MAG: chitosanase [Chloroflexota bacterium]